MNTISVSSPAAATGATAAAIGTVKDGFTEKSDDERAIDHATADLAELEALLGHLVGIYMAVSS